MKKIVLSAFVIGCMFVNATAQTVKYGVKGGVNFASISGDLANDTDMGIKTSIHIGGVAEVTIFDRFMLQPEVLFSSQGARYSYSELGIPTDAIDRINYVNVPVMGKFYITDGFNVQAGPQVGFLLSGEEELEAAGITTKEDIKDKLKKIDVGVGFGLGYKLSAGLFFDARYNLGLLDIAETAFDNSNSVIQLSVGFLF